MVFSALAATVVAQDMGELPAMEAEGFEGGMPVTELGGGDFFSQELGTLLRMRYNTQSYGQDRRGNLDIGTMQVANFADAIGFFDAQVTLSDVSGVGFNAGVGFRWLHWTPFLPERQRISGVSVWADGTSTASGNFFPQVGVSYESLGDQWDLRVNSYIPLGSKSQLGTFEPTGNIVFDENFLVLEALADRNTSFNVGELEVARRLLGDRDAWAFAGPYALSNSDEDAVGYRVGMRGYAYPDLLLQIAVSDDDIFHTNAAFSVTWFVGRTRTNFRPACGLPDRMREPVMRNDYVTLAKTIERGGEPLTDTDGNAFRFVHVNSAAADGGDGTFENPLNDVGNVEGNSIEDDIVLMWANSIFTGQDTLVLQDNQQLLGEGNGETFTITTQQEGIVDIPETSPGARDGDRPIILGALSMGAVQLADTNEVANFDIDGTGSMAGVHGIFSPTTGAGNPNIHDMEIHDVTGDGIVFTPLTRDNDDDPATPQVTVAGNVTIDDMVFDSVAGSDINIDSATTTDINDANVTLQETILISDVLSTDGGDFSLDLSNTHAGTGRSTTITGFTYNGGIGTAGGIRLTDFDGTLNASTSTLRNGTQAGLQIAGESDGNIMFASTVTFTSIDGTVIDIGPNLTDDFTGTLSVLGDITMNDTGQLVSIQRTSDNASLTFGGVMMDVADAGSEGIFIGNNMDGTILFTGNLTVDTTNFIAIQLMNNGTTDIRFDGVLDIDADSANGFDAENGTGNLIVSNTGNSINTDGGTGLRIVDSTIGTVGANFADVDVTGGATNGIFLQDNEGGPITVGAATDLAGDAGTIELTSGDAVVIENSENVSITGLQIDATAGNSGVLVTKTNTSAQVVDLSDLLINGGDIGIEVDGNGSTGALTMSANDIDIMGPTDIGVLIDDIDTGTLQFMGVNVDGMGTTATAGVRIVGSNATISFDADSLIEDVVGTAFDVDGGSAGTITMQGDIMNTAGRSISVQNRTGGTVSFASTNAVTDTGTGILVDGNSGGAIVNFQGDYTLNTAANDAITVTNNSGATTNFNPGANNLDIDTTSGSGFVAMGGGTLSVTGNANTITSMALGVGKFGLQIEGMTSATADFENVTTTGGDNGIRLVDNAAGTVTVGDAGAGVGVGGMILNSTENGVHVQNSNVTLNGVTVTDAGDAAGEDSVLIRHSNTVNMTANLNNLTISTDRDGLSINGTGGTNTFNVNSTNGTIDADETDIEVQGQLSTVNLAQDITSTAGRSIHVHNVTGGTMTHTGDVSDTGGTGVLIEDNTGGNINLLGSDYSLSTGVNAAVTIDNNTGANIQLTNLDIDTTTGAGFTATSGGTLTVSGTTNTINTTTGTGVDVEDMTIGAGGANFQSVTVNGAANGIVLDNLAGGQVAVTGTGTTDGSGGTLTTTGDAIVLTNVQNVDLSNITITSSADDGVVINHNNTATTTMDVTIDNLEVTAATNAGVLVTADDNSNFMLRLLNSNIESNVAMTASGSGDFLMLVEDTTIDAQVGSGDVGLSLNFSGSLDNADVTLRDIDVTADDASALSISASGGTPKFFDLLIDQGSTFTNDDADSAALIQATGGTTINASIYDNTFTNNGAGESFEMIANGASVDARLDLEGNTANAGAGNFELNNVLSASDFEIFDLTNTFNNSRNTGTVVPLPNPAAFQDRMTPVPLPTIP